MVADLNHSTAELEQRDAQLAERNTRAMERIAASQEENATINRAMALINAMKPAPTPAPILAPPPARVNCTTTKIGNTSYTNCN
jgi:hypothetical protein